VSFGDLYQRGAAEPGRTPAQMEQMYDQARKAYQQALKIDSKCVPAHLSLARLYDKTGDHTRAVASYHKVLDLKPKDAVVWHELGMSHARAKEWDKAVEGLTTAADLDKENKQFARSLGFCLARAGQHEKSYTALCRAENEATAHFDVARMLHHIHQDELSKQHLRLALQADPKLAQAQEMLVELETGAPAAQQLVPAAAPGTGAPAAAGRS
jgi:tetratricopeptide (TPR) repeat protein